MHGTVGKFVTLVIVCLLLSTAAFGQDMFKARADFLSGNPNGEWTLGCLDKDGQFVPFNSKFEVQGKLVGWTLDGCPDVNGSATLNVTSAPIDLFGGRWEPGQTCVEPGRAGRGVVVRWTAPTNAQINIRMKLTGQESSGAKTAVSVTKQGTQLFSDSLDGFVGNAPDGTGRTGSRPDLESSVSTEVMAGNLVDLIIAPSGVDRPSGGRVGIELAIDRLDASGAVFSTTSPPYAIASKGARPEVIASAGGKG